MSVSHIDMGLGQSPFDPPAELIECLSVAAKDPKAHIYSRDPLGLEELRRKADCVYPQHVLITPGARAAVTAILSAWKKLHGMKAIVCLPKETTGYWSGYVEIADGLGMRTAQARPSDGGLEDL